MAAENKNGRHLPGDVLHVLADVLDVVDELSQGDAGPAFDGTVTFMKGTKYDAKVKYDFDLGSHVLVV